MKNGNKQKGKSKTETKGNTTINTDPFGSWTGIVEDNIYDEPIQDVDDL